MPHPPTPIDGYADMVGVSACMRCVFDTIRRVAATNVTVHLTGESGTGKELVARALHANSPRSRQNFVPLNCAALSETVLESELFGHEKGAFTGALYQRKGRFEFAHHGTLFLDEIGDMPTSTQVKLLRVIEYGEIARVGSNEPIKVDVRLITATNQDLTALIREKKFREDLYYRLNVVTIDVPPLRERQEDINPLIDHFVRHLAHVHQRTIMGLTLAARSLLFKYPWPGNVREFKNCVESMVVMAKTDTLDIDDVPLYVRAGTDKDQSQVPPTGILTEPQMIQEAVRVASGNVSLAAKNLGMSTTLLLRKLRRLEVRRVVDDMLRG